MLLFRGPDANRRARAVQVDLKKINLEVVKPWVTQRVTDLLGFEDEVVINMVHNMLTTPGEKGLDPKEMQITLTGFMHKNAKTFMEEMWRLLLNAQKNPKGIPEDMLEKKKQEIAARQVHAAPRTLGRAPAAGPHTRVLLRPMTLRLATEATHANSAVSCAADARTPAQAEKEKIQEEVRRKREMLEKSAHGQQRPAEVKPVRGRDSCRGSRALTEVVGGRACWCCRCSAERRQGRAAKGRSQGGKQALLLSPPQVAVTAQASLALRVSQAVSAPIIPAPPAGQRPEAIALARPRTRTQRSEALAVRLPRPRPQALTLRVAGPRRRPQALTLRVARALRPQAPLSQRGPPQGPPQAIAFALPRPPPPLPFAVQGQGRAQERRQEGRGREGGCSGGRTGARCGADYRGRSRGRRVATGEENCAGKARGGASSAGVGVPEEGQLSVRRCGRASCPAPAPVECAASISCVFRQRSRPAHCRLARATLLKSLIF